MIDQIFEQVKKNTQSLFSAISKNKWFVVGVVAAVFNPIPSGIVLGLVLLSEPKLAKIGRLVISISIVLAVVIFIVYSFSVRR